MLGQKQNSKLGLNLCKGSTKAQHDTLPDLETDTFRNSTCLSAMRISRAGRIQQSDAIYYWEHPCLK